jgi:hypothetical protein
MTSLGLLLVLSLPANRLGSPVCEVNQLPLVPMSSTLSSPPPAGWQLKSNRSVTSSGAGLRFTISHPDPNQRLRGILLWVKRGDGTGGVGSFATSADYQHIPAPANCEQWALSHNNNTARSWQNLSFNWTAPANLAEGTLIARAFIIEDCNQPSCRSFQALTNVVEIDGAVFANGYED